MKILFAERITVQNLISMERDFFAGDFAGNIFAA